MAELEMAQGDEGRAREWMARALNARRDPAWTADAFVSDHWLPISPVSGRLDAFEWKDPLAGEDHGPVIEHAAEAASVPATVATPRPAHTCRGAPSPPCGGGTGRGHAKRCIGASSPPPHRGTPRRNASRGPRCGGGSRPSMATG